MDVSAMTSATVNSASGAGGGHRGGRIPGFVQTAAKALGMSGSDVMSALKSGKSLADLAKQRNVSVDSLSAALKANAPQSMQNSGNVDQAVSALVNRQGLGGHRHVDAGSGAASVSGSQNETLTALSNLLGSDPSSLLQQLQSGTSLSDLLSAQGVSMDALSSQLQKGLLIDTQA
jgi:lambda repressor-like predicted transcriptional regulator